MTTHKMLTEQLQHYQTRCSELDAALATRIEEVENAKLSSQKLAKDLEEHETKQSTLVSMLQSDISTVKQQKAKLRCEFLRADSELKATSVSEMHLSPI